MFLKPFNIQGCFFLEKRHKKIVFLVSINRCMTTQAYQQQADSVRAHCIMVSIFREKDSTKKYLFFVGSAH